MIFPSSEEKDSDNSHGVVVQDDAAAADGAFGNLDAPHGYVGCHYSCLLSVLCCAGRLNVKDVCTAATNGRQDQVGVKAERCCVGREHSK